MTALFGSNKKEKKAASQNAGEPRQGRDEFKVGTKEKSAVFSGGNFKVLKRPVISEKALSLESKGEYVFIVEPSTTKPEVKKEVERKYGVKVERVNMMVYKPERTFFRGKAGEKTGFKKAMVKLVAGHKIELLPK